MNTLLASTGVSDSMGPANMLLSNFVFPNDFHVHWSMMIVLYPYITGLVDGAFIIAALYYLFDVKSLRPVARFSLLFALAFLAIATLDMGSGPGEILTQQVADLTLGLASRQVGLVIPTNGVVGEVLAHEMRHVGQGNISK